MWVVMGSVGLWGFEVHSPHHLWSSPQATRDTPKALSSMLVMEEVHGSAHNSNSRVQENLPEKKIKKLSANIEKIA